MADGSSYPARKADLPPHLADVLAKVEAAFGKARGPSVPYPNYGAPADPVDDHDPPFEHGTYQRAYYRRAR